MNLWIALIHLVKLNLLCLGRWNLLFTKINYVLEFLRVFFFEFLKFLNENTIRSVLMSMSRISKVSNVSKVSQVSMSASSINKIPKGIALIRMKNLILEPLNIIKLFLLYLTEWIVHGTGIVPIEKAIKKRNNLKHLLYIYIVHAISWYSCSVWVFINLLGYTASPKV